MTLPHLENCRHCCNEWCIPCVKKMHDEYEQRCEAYRKEIEDLRFLLNDALENLKSYRNGGPVF